MKEQKWIHEGLIAESLSNGIFLVSLHNEDMILGYVLERRASLVCTWST